MAIKIAGTEVINDNRELVLAKLTEINSSIADTAVDVFVYDTRKDSDGGAWRKRTQHTSWYNETLNTATRGSRKEFPAVAVIVAESNQVTIYDGDDPDLPMWMVINAGGGDPLYGGAQVTSCAALNGSIYVGVGVTAAGSLSVFEFIKDQAYLRINTTSTYNLVTIAKRNNGYASDTITGTAPAIVNRYVNDVAMTVLPNAPIDAATGLPVPTIAVATDGGVSVIKDDGTVESESDTVAINGLTIVDNKYLQIVRDSNTVPLEVMPLLNVDTVSTRTYRDDGDNSSSYPSLISGLNPTGVISPNAVGGSGLVLIDEDYDSVSSNTTGGMVAYVTSSYNSGYQNGDIKLATLSDTDDTDVTGSELVTNGTFDSDLSSWVASISVWSSGTAAVGGSGGNGYIYQNMGLVTGQTYVITFDVTATTSGSLLVIQNSNSGSTSGGIYSDNDPPVGSYSVTFTASNNTLSFVVGGGNSAVVNIDNISVRIAEEDRSVNGNGLQVFGTVTKNPVATGADLVAYSGFDTGDKLIQPYNADLDFGTGDFCMMGWIKGSSEGAYKGVFLRKTLNDNTRNGYGIDISSLNELRFHTRDGTSNTDVLSTASVLDGTWKHFAAYRQNGVMYLYINGIYNNSNSGTVRSTTNNTAVTMIGSDPLEVDNYFGGSLALLRISATAPSAEQIKKIYEDEKVLFQENAQATLYGSSDAVTALAYDDSTELLHVGTSAGRSVFQGLRRVDNTTTAVGAAISASNGLVADE